MKYLNFIQSLDLLQHAHPNYYSSELFLLADDVLRWINEEFTQDNSALVYLKSMYSTPYEALEDILRKIQLLSIPLIDLN